MCGESGTAWVSFGHLWRSKKKNKKKKIWHRDKKNEKGQKMASKLAHIP